MIGEPFILRKWQERVIKGIYGSPTRRAIISFGRKNGKTSLAAVLLLLHLCGIEARRNSELYSSALSRDQAAILFRLAAKIVRLSPSLREQVIVRDTVKQLYCPELGTLYTALSADASTNFGLSPVFICHDELGQVRGPRHPLYEALETATGAQEAPLSVVISTQSPNDSDLLSVLIDDASAANDPKTKLFLFTADVDADPFSKKTIKQANPAFGEFQNSDEVLAMAEDARRMPSREAEYRNLILNQRVEASNPFVTKSVWDQNNALPAPLRREIYCGLDLSSTNDLTALVMVAPAGEFLDVECVFWLPAEGLKERARVDRTLYDVWFEEGYLKTTPGRSIQYEYVARFIADLMNERDVRGIAFDRWNMRHLRPWLIKAGIPESVIDARFHNFGQGWVEMSPALRTLEEKLLNGEIRHGGQPVLQMCAANAVVRMDERANRTLDKKRIARAYRRYGSTGDGYVISGCQVSRETRLPSAYREHFGDSVMPGFGPPIPTPPLMLEQDWARRRLEGSRKHGFMPSPGLLDQLPYHALPGQRGFPRQFSGLPQPAGGLLGGARPPADGLLQKVIFDKVRQGLSGKPPGTTTAESAGGGGWTPKWEKFEPRGGVVATHRGARAVVGRDADVHLLETPSGVNIQATRWNRGDFENVANMSFSRWGGETTGPSTGRAINTFSDVFTAVKNYAQTFKPKAITYGARTEAHKKVYDRLSPKVARELGGTLSKPSSKQWRIDLPENE